MSEQEKFDSWAVIDLFGHQQIAGRVTEASIGGCSFLRVDVPDQPAIPPSEVHNWDRGNPAVPAYTRYLGQASIYSMTPCSEAVARSMATRLRAAPPIQFDPQPGPARLTAPTEADFFDGQDDDPDAP